MSEEDLKKITELCEVCHLHPASFMQGGIVNGVRDMWLCCKECKQHIIDERKNERRKT